MQVKELGDILDQLRAMHDAEGATAQANDFQRVLETLEGHEDESVVEFVENMQRLLQAAKSDTTTEKGHGADISGYVEELKATGVDRAAFEAVFDKLVSDRAMRKQDIIEVALAYTGYKMSYKTKKAALDEIRTKFSVNERHDARMSLIDKVTPW